MSYLPGMMTAWDGSDSRAAPCVRRWPGAGGLAGSHPGVAVARFEVPDGWTVQAFTFALDCTPGQAACVRRQFGGRRYARNWAVRTLKDDIARYRETGEAWWPEISKEAFADGVRAAVDGYWNWQASRAGTRQGRRVGFPRFAKKGRDRVPNPRPLEAALKELRHLCRERSRRARGSRRYAETSRRITGARARRRGLSDSALGETRRQPGYKTGWYGSRLVVAGRFFPPSKTCHVCGHVQDIGWAGHWTCEQCGTCHQRDDNAAVNLARYEEASPAGTTAVGPVGAAVKRRAGRKTGPRPAGGDEARKGRSRTAAEQPRDGVPAG